MNQFFNLSSPGGLNLKVLELFVSGYGGQRVRAVLSRERLFDDDPCALWSNALVPTAITIMKLLYPLLTDWIDQPPWYKSSKASRSV